MMAHDRKPRRAFRFPWRTLEEIGAEVDEEMRFHLQMRAEELARGGMPADEALARARREFGDVEAARSSLARTDERREDARRRTEWVAELRQDARYALRTLRARPGFTAVAAVTLALGIGANAALFSVVNAVLLRALPYAEPERLASVWPEGSLPLPALEMVRSESRSFAAVEGYATAEYTLTGQGEPARLEGARATPGLFGMLGVAPALGRAFLPGEDQPGRNRVVLLSDALWRQRFGEDPSVVGRTVRLGGESHTVVGVMPPTFRFPSRNTRLWTPTARDPNPFVEWGSSWMVTVARLRPGATVEGANAEIGAAMDRVRAGFPWKMTDDWGREAGVVPLRDQVVGETGPMLLVLLGAVGFVLLIACVNVANLLLARAAVRQKEIAIRSALGAGRGRLARQLLTESAVLAVLGGAAGLALGAIGVRVLRAALPADTPRLDEIGMDARVLLFTLAVTLVTGILFGALPALRASRTELAGTLAEGGRGGGGGPGRQRLTAALVAAEVALAVVLVTGAGLLVRSFWNLVRVDPGFRVENLVSATVSPPEERYADDAGRRALYAELVERLERLPGATSAAAGT
ncbi:MAG TPA: ABC transporter permease, partial [Longimicrobium sp.]|nr:ABC transporter permease [Longimicrobium sp.]